MTGKGDAGEVLRELWARIGTQDWDGMADLLDPRMQARYTHTGEIFGAGALVRLNRDYPGKWRADVEAIVDAGDRAVSRARVYDGQQAYHVASFATVGGGKITDLVEVWAEDGQSPPPDRR